MYISYLYFSAMLFMFTLVYREIIMNKEDDELKKPVSYFSKSFKTGRMDICLTYFWLVIFLMMFLDNYANNIYPYIPINFGGAKYTYDVIVLHDDQYLNGQIIFQNTDYVYLLDKEQKLFQIKRETIKYYKN